MLYNRTRTYSLFQLNRDSPARASSVALSSTFDTFGFETLHTFDGSRTGIHKFIDRKSESERRHKRTRISRERCEHPWDEAAAAAVRTPVRRANVIFSHRDRPALASPPRAVSGFATHHFAELRPRAIGGGPGRQSKRTFPTDASVSDGFRDATSTSIDVNISLGFTQRRRKRAWTDRDACSVSGRVRNSRRFFARRPRWTRRP